MYSAPQTPRSIGGVIDDAIELTKAGFGSCWVISVLYAVVGAALGGYLQWTTLPAPGAAPDPAATLAAFASPTLWVCYLLLIVWGALAYVMLSRCLLNVARGRSDAGGLSQLAPSLRLLPAALVAVLLMLLGMICGMVLFIIPGLYLVFRWSLWTVALVDEERGGTAALRTSWRLVGGYWWRTTIILSVIGILALIVTLLLGMVFGFAAAALRMDRATIAIGTQLVQALTSVFYAPLVIAALIAVYNDLKLRKEGGDLATRLGAVQAPAS